MSVSGAGAHESGPRVTGALGKYRLLAELGHGGMADVYLAVAQGHAGFNKLCVLKLLRPSLAADQDFLEMFLDEARLAARLNHPNVVQTNEIAFEGGRHLLVMEYLDGQALSAIHARLRKQEQRMPLGLNLRAIAEALAGLHYAHQLTGSKGEPLGIVHRDVSPHNVFVTYDGQVKVLDFGVAKASTSSIETRTGVLKGKLAYMSPEQMHAATIDRRADIYAAGVMLWEAATGTRMWKGQQDIYIMNKVLNGEIPSVQSVAPETPPELVAIIDKALAHDPDQRYATCLELQLELERYLETLGQGASTRALGAFVVSAFADIRAQTKALIEAELPRVEAATSSDLDVARAFPRIDAMAGEVTPHNLTPSGAFGPVSGRSYDAGGHPGGPGNLTGTILSPHGRGGAPSRGRLILAGIALVGLGAVTASALVLRQPTAPLPEAVAMAAPPEPPVPSAPAPSPAEAPPRRDVELRVQVVPTDATLFLDDAPLGRGMVQKLLPRSASSHHLRAEAKGYAAKTFDFTLDADVNVILTLDRVGAPSSGSRGVHRIASQPAAPASTPSATPVPAPPVAPAPSALPPSADTPKARAPQRTPRKLDSANPWD